MNKQAPRSRPARPSVRKKKPLASGDTDAPGLRRHDDRTRIGPIGRSNDHSHRMLRTAIDSKAYISFRYLQARRIGPFFDPDVAFLEDVALFFQDQFPVAVALVVADTALADLLHIQGHFPRQAIDGWWLRLR